MSMEEYGFYLNDLNKNTFLYNSLKRNQIENTVPFFHDLKDRQRYKKWLCPIYSDITLFDNYQVTVANLRQTIEANNGYYFFDLSIEAIPYYPLDSYLSQKLKSFHFMLEMNNIDPSKVFFVNANLVADKYYDVWRKKMSVNYRIENQMLTHQYSLSGFSDSFKMYFGRNNLFEKNIELVEMSIRNNIKRRFYFTCLMLRPRFHRTTIMLHLLERGHRDKGIISYYGDEWGNKSACTVEPQAVTYNLINQLPSGKRLLSKWEAMTQLGSVMADTTTLATIKEHGYSSQELGFFTRPFFEDTSSLNSRSYFEIVTETHFTDETCLYLTEKTIWAIVGLHPFIIVGSPYTLQYLKDLGFQTFSPFIDESYDNVSDPNLRIELIMKEIDRLCAMSIDEIHDLYSELWPRLLHNYHLYFNQSKTLAVQEIQKRILTLI